MSTKKRVHLIDPKASRADRFANDNKTRQGLGKSVSVSGLKKPIAVRKPAYRASRKYGLPDPSELARPEVLDSVIDRFLADDAAMEDFHHEYVRIGVVRRYKHALDLVNNPDALSIWKCQPRIAGLDRPPKSENDTCRSLFRASYGNHKAASKRYKRIEHLWLKRCPAAEVAAFLEKNGVGKPLAKANPATETLPIGKAKLRLSKMKKRSADGDPPVAINPDDPPGGSFQLWPGKIVVDKLYDLRVKVVDHDGELTVFELLDVSHVRVQ